jgi:hypothetical protein
VSAELVVQVPRVRPDRVHRHVQLAGDLRRGQAGLQERQDADLGLAERLGQVLRRVDGGRRWAPPAQDSDDLPGQRQVRRPPAGMAFEQLRQRVQLEREEQAIRLGEIEPSLEGVSGRLPLAERGPGARLKQPSRGPPHRTGGRGRAVENEGERGGRRPWSALS